MPTIISIGGSAASLDIVTAMTNIALLRLGANVLTSINDTAPNAIKVRAVWDYVRDEVLQQRDWRFAKTRYTMVVSATAPLYGYDYAYVLPTNFLRLVKPHGPQTAGLNPAANPPGGYNYQYYVRASGTGSTVIVNDPPVYPTGYPYIIESLPDGTLALFTDYDNTTDPLYINYIKKETDATKYTPTFKSCMIYRLAEELATAITESQVKSRDMGAKYREYLYSSEAVNESSDYLQDETGNSDWENAGR